MRLFFSTQFLARFLLLIGVIAFLLVGLLGFSQAEMITGPDGDMSSSDCFMPGMTASLCQMNPLEHISTWQNMFTAVPSQSDIFLLLAVLLALVSSVVFLHSYRNMAPQRVLALQPSLTYYKRHVPIVSSLQEAFSSGILHPKLFWRPIPLN